MEQISNNNMNVIFNKFTGSKEITSNDIKICNIILAENLLRAGKQYNNFLIGEYGTATSRAIESCLGYSNISPINNLVAKNSISDNKNNNDNNNNF
jgi:hypothetical protein